MKFKVVPVLASFFVGWQVTVAPAATNLVTLTYTQAPLTNPLKGFVPYQNSSVGNFPCSMEWNYLPLRPIMSGLGSFNWSSLDNLLSNIASRGHQTVFRIYLDYPTLTTGVPQFLFNEGLGYYNYTDYGNDSCSSYTNSDISSCSGSVSPYYTDTNLQQALTNFISAFGERYDGDPRIGFITVGLLGYWGEWHTYPETQDFASTTVQSEVLTAYQAAFTKTKLEVRYADYPTARYAIGFHDDSFCYDTLPGGSSDSFYGGIQDYSLTNGWRTQSIGGEVYPNVQSCLFSGCAPSGEDFTSCVTTTHATWLLNYYAFSPGYSGSQLTAAMAGAHLLGYELYVPSATIVDAQLSGPLNVSVQVTNTAVAPFYYNWSVQLRVLNSGGTAVQTWTTPWQLTSLQPGTNTTLSFTQTNHGLALGQYKLLMGVTNVMSGGPVLSFANTEMNANQSGWLTLGSFSVISNAVVASPVTITASTAGATVYLAFPTQNGVSYTVQYTTSLTPASWQTLTTTNGTGAVAVATDTIGGAVPRLYRVLSSP